MKKFTALLMSAILLLGLLSGCGKTEEKPKGDTATTVSTAASTTTTTTADSTTTTETEGTTGTTVNDTTVETTTTTTKVTTTTTTITTAPTKPAVTAKLNGVSLSEYVIVYDNEALDYTERAATYIHDEILKRTGADLEVVKDNTADPAKHEIVVGETDRAISKALNAKTEGLQFSLMAKDGHVAMEGDYFIIAAAAYYFVTTYVTGKTAATTVPSKATVCNPIQEKANNYFLLIGDGMGENQTMLPKGYDREKMYTDEGTTNFTDGEDFFYGHLFPNAGYARTRSYDSDVTDSAAGATALATGYKTKNGFIGKDPNKNDLKSITELAGDLGMATAVMTTEGIAGATPGGFSAHQDFRDMYDEIKADQAAMTEKYGTIFHSNYDNYNRMGMWSIDTDLDKTFKSLSQNEKGIFMMYEEAYIDKHCHNQDEEKATWAIFRFNQAIARFMEFAFYNPDTMVIITADHETGSLTNMAGKYYCATGDHSSRDVPVYAYGVGTEIFNGVTIENVQIPKTIAKMWGQSLASDTDSQYPPLV